MPARKTPSRAPAGRKSAVKDAAKTPAKTAPKTAAKASSKAAVERTPAKPAPKAPSRSRAERPASALRARYGGWALVAGSAEGMGAAYAERLAREGFDLVLLDLRQADVDAQAARLSKAHGVATRALACDLSQPRVVKATLDAVADLEVGLVIFNAAMAANGPWAEISLATKLRAVEVNVSAVLTMTDRLSRPMLERGRGGIVLTSSMAALQGAPGQAVYAATKSFDLILAESLWAELGPKGVDVMALIPGMVRTPNFERSGASRSANRLLAPIEPDQAVDEALAALGKEPSMVPGRTWKAVAVAGSLAPRRTMIEAIGKYMAAGLEPRR